VIVVTTDDGDERALYREAWSRNVILMSPTTLLVTLRITANLWMRKQQSENAQAIAKQCASLYDKFVGFVADLEQIGKKLDESREAFTSAKKKLSSGRDNLVRQVERVRELDVKPTKALPAALVEKSLYEGLSDESLADAVDEQVELAAAAGNLQT